MVLILLLGRIRTNSSSVSWGINELFEDAWMKTLLSVGKACTQAVGTPGIFPPTHPYIRQLQSGPIIIITVFILLSFPSRNWGAECEINTNTFTSSCFA